MTASVVFWGLQEHLRCLEGGTGSDVDDEGFAEEIDLVSLTQYLETLLLLNEQLSYFSGTLRFSSRFSFE